jgi:hypothetical protein
MSYTVIKAFRKDLKDFTISKGTIRFPSRQNLPDTIVKTMVKSTDRGEGPGASYFFRVSGSRERKIPKSMPGALIYCYGSGFCAHSRPAAGSSASLRERRNDKFLGVLARFGIYEAYLQHWD